MKRVKVTVTRSLCASCGLKSSHCQCREQALNEHGDNGESVYKLTTASFCVLYLMYALLATGLYLILFMTLEFVMPRSCYLEIFADSFFLSNVSNANATADWNVGFTTRSPANKCKFSLHTIKSRLLHGDKLISESATHDYVGLIVTDKINDIPLPYAVFKTVETPRVVWDLQVEVLSSVKIDGQCHHKDGFLILTCGSIPVNFSADPAGNVKGTLLGYKRPCEYLFREEFPLTYF